MVARCFDPELLIVAFHIVDAAKAKAVEEGRMKVTIGSERMGTAQNWEDTKGAKIEAKLREVVIGLLIAGEAHYRAAAQAHHDWLIEYRAELVEEGRRRKAEEEHRERERLAMLERERLDRLFAAADAWRRAGDLRAFVEAVRTANRDMNTPIDAVEQWAAEALTAADRLDPLRGAQFHFKDRDETKT